MHNLHRNHHQASDAVIHVVSLGKRWRSVCRILLSLPPLFSDVLGKKEESAGMAEKAVCVRLVLSLPPSLTPAFTVDRLWSEGSYPWAWDSRKKWPMDRGAC